MFVVRLCFSPFPSYFLSFHHCLHHDTSWGSPWRRYVMHLQTLTPLSFPVLGKQCLKQWPCSRAQRAWEGKGLCLDGHGWTQAVCLPNQTTTTKVVFLFTVCSLSREPEVLNLAGREWEELLLGEEVLAGDWLLLFCFILQPAADEEGENYDGSLLLS